MPTGIVQRSPAPLHATAYFGGVFDAIFVKLELVEELEVLVVDVLANVVLGGAVVTGAGVGVGVGAGLLVVLVAMTVDVPELVPDVDPVVEPVVATDTPEVKGVKPAANEVDDDELTVPVVVLVRF